MKTVQKRLCISTCAYVDIATPATWFCHSIRPIYGEIKCEHVQNMLTTFKLLQSQLSRLRRVKSGRYFPPSCPGSAAAAKSPHAFVRIWLSWLSSPVSLCNEIEVNERMEDL